MLCKCIQHWKNLVRFVSEAHNHHHITTLARPDKDGTQQTAILPHIIESNSVLKCIVLDKETNGIGRFLLEITVADV